ncbi:methyltransferase family protein [Mycobacterium spongiae]|uniref:Isoprenylcysteine carboxylmethyltransferase family protein n=1 Tax=Mycobacterium spongiae TaxID=886343 RepID=A0A975JYX6_9MYCO|nr:isoprenylcysteine carboxylmethyltransferase family protein [Mycobacterium spongiae]QUR68271.1 isoprenylcysteine carboxylmethyltransferase family protein [Mycobacterium spongiae]
MPATTSADIALVLFAVFALLGFGWRSWVQYRRTGSSGYRGVSGRIGSPEWLAGIGFAVALMVTVAGVIVQRIDLVRPLAVLTAVWIQVAGILVAVVGIVATVYAQLAMGDSWRIGVDEQESTTLVATGPFGWVRNPIYTAMFVFSLGVVLLTPNLAVFAGFILLVCSIEVQVRVVEEPYLLREHGDSYRAYCAKVGRFVPAVGRIR